MENNESVFFPRPGLGTDALKIFETLPDRYLIISPEMTVLTASNSYLKASLKVREEIAGKNVSEVFRALPGTPEAETLENLNRSLQKVLRTKQEHKMPVQRFGSQKQGSDEKDASYRASVNIPVLNENGDLLYIIHKIAEVTEQVQSENRVSRGGYILKSIFDSPVVGIAVYKSIRDEAGNIIDFRFILASKLTEQFLNRGPLPGKRLLELFPGVKENGLFYKWIEVVENNSTRDIEDSLANLGYPGKWVRYRGVKIDDGLVINWIDITEEKRFQLELEEKNQFIQQITETIPDIIFVFDIVQNRVVYTNAPKLKSGKYKHAYLSNLILQAENIEIHENDYINRLEYIADLPSLADHEVRSIEFRVKAADNEWVWFCGRDTILKRTEDGQIIQVLSICQDISKQKNAEEELIKQHHILHQAEDLAAIGSWEYDIELDKMTWSEGMYELFELKAGSPISPELYLDYVVDPEKPKMRRIISLIKKKYKPFEDEIILSIGGREKIIRLKAVATHNKEGRPEKMLGVDMDISSKRAAEAQLKEIEGNRLKEIFTAVINAQEEERRLIAEALHNEFGQLLSVAKMKIASDNFEASRLLNQAIIQVRNISYELMPDILKDFGMEFAVKDMISKKMGDVRIKHRTAIRGFKERIESVLEIAIYRIIQEILNNIVKHSKASAVSIELVKKGTVIHLKIADDGIGFMTAEKSTDSKGGFGLKYIKNRVHLLKGEMKMGMNKDKGTVVSIEIPFLALS